MTERNRQAEWLHLWAWARSVSVLHDLPETMRWDDEDERLFHFDNSRIVRFDVTVIYTGRSRREEATIKILLPNGSTITEAMAVPADVSAAALAAGQGT